MKALIKDTAEAVMRQMELSRAPVLLPVDDDHSEDRHRLVKAWLNQKNGLRMYVQDRRERHRAVIGFMLSKVRP